MGIFRAGGGPGFQGFSDNNGSFTTINFPSSSNTFPEGVAGNTIVGVYNIPAVDNGDNQGFIYNGSTYSAFNDPLGVGSAALGISGSTIVGTFSDSLGVHGYVYTPSTGFTTLDDPFARAAGSTQIFPRGVSGSSVVGFYTIGNSDHGFLYDGSTYTTLDDPLAGSGGTEVSAISGSTIVGTYMDIYGNSHGFIYNRGSYTTLDNPLGGTALSGIDGTTIVGDYNDGNNITNGFIATPIPEPASILLLLTAWIFALRHPARVHRVIHGGEGWRGEICARG